MDKNSSNKCPYGTELYHYAMQHADKDFKYIRKELKNGKMRYYYADDSVGGSSAKKESKPESLASTSYKKKTVEPASSNTTVYPKPNATKQNSSSKNTTFYDMRTGKSIRVNDKNAKNAISNTERDYKDGRISKREYENRIKILKENYPDATNAAGSANTSNTRNGNVPKQVIKGTASNSSKTASNKSEPYVSDEYKQELEYNSKKNSFTNDKKLPEPTKKKVEPTSSDVSDEYKQELEYNSKKNEYPSANTKDKTPVEEKKDNSDINFFENLLGKDEKQDYQKAKENYENADREYKRAEEQTKKDHKMLTDALELRLQMGRTNDPYADKLELELAQKYSESASKSNDAFMNKLAAERAMKEAEKKYSRTFMGLGSRLSDLASDFVDTVEDGIDEAKRIFTELTRKEADGPAITRESIVKDMEAKRKEASEYLGPTMHKALDEIQHYVEYWAQKYQTADAADKIRFGELYLDQIEEYRSEYFKLLKLFTGE